MIDPEIQARIEAVESQLPEPFPTEYRSFLEGERPSFPALGPWDSGWERAVSGFQREWHPAGGRLFPVEHCGEGIFACLWLRHEGSIPIIAWDIAADLGEQPTLQLASDWQSFAAGRTIVTDGPENNPLLDPFADATSKIVARRHYAEADLNRRLQAFEETQERFNNDYASVHQGARFEHHLENAKIKAAQWRPERFAVHDHLLGVMASRYNKYSNTIDVVGFTTRDHTNYARGSATAGLLSSLLCDCAAKAAAGVRFLKKAPLPEEAEQLDFIPHEIVLLSAVLGIELNPRAAVVPAAAAGRLLLQLTPFSANDRLTLAESALNPLRVCLAVHKQVWLPVEAALLARWCPQAEEIFSGDIDVGEMVRFASTLNHCVAAMLAAFGVKVAETAAETMETGTPKRTLSNCRYSAACRSTAITVWKEAVSGNILELGPNQELIILGVAALDAVEGSAVDRLDLELDKTPGAINATVLAVVPHRTRVARHGQRIRFVAADRNAADLNDLIQKRLRMARRIRS